MLSKALAAAAKATQPAYVEDVFQTWLYTGNGSTQTITNGVDLSGKGGLVWIKGRSGATNHRLFDTAGGATNFLESNSTAQQQSSAISLTSFNSDGFSIGASSPVNTSSATYASWTFRKQAKFFDVVTFNYTSGSIRVPHSLGSVPGCIIVKYVGGTSDWYVYHRSRGRNYYSRLNQNLAEINVSDVWDTTDPTSTDFGMSNYLLTAGTWVAYVFAHDAGGFGASGSDSIIKCGTYTGNGSSSGPQVDLSWEPQWLMLKRTNGAAGWYIYDNMRGVATGGVDANLRPNSSGTEDSSFDYLDLNATGFKLTTTSNDHNGNGDTYIYIAIRRGPMKTPTDATKVFDVDAFTSNNSSSQVISVGFAADIILGRERTTTANTASQWPLGTRMLGNGYLRTTQTAAEVTFLDMVNGWDDQNSIDLAGIMIGNGNQEEILYAFRRAPGFFDVVAYTGTGANRTVSHNLGVVPELMIVKNRGTDNWIVYSAATGNTDRLVLDLDVATASSSTLWNNTTPGTSSFTVGSNSVTNAASNNFIAYLFASCPGVSKVGSYTGTGTTLSIDCGFTAGARFVLIKRTDSTGDWYVWDTARGIVSGNDSYLLLNSTAAEVTNTDYIDPLSSGFQISSTAPAAINANGGSFIYLAIA